MKRKKIIGGIMAVLLCFMFSSCTATETGSSRDYIEDYSIFYQYNSDNILFSLGTGSYVNLNVETYDYSITSGRVSGVSYTEKWVTYEFQGKISKTDDFYYLDDNWELAINSYAQMVLDFLGDEKAVNAACFVFDGVRYAMANVYTAYRGADGTELYKEDIAVSYYFTFDDGGICLLNTFEKCVIVALTDRYVMYERGNTFYSYDSETGTETALFDDEEYDRPLQHNNEINIKFNGEYVIFERIRARISGNYVTYTIAAMDGSLSLDVYSGTL